MTIVAADPSSAARIAAIHKRSFDDGWSINALKDLLQAPGVFVFCDEPITGFILFRVAADEGEVLTVAVDPSGRRLGLGRQLLQAAARQSALAGCRMLFLEVASDNASALSLYRSEGFEETGRRRAYYSRREGAGVDALILRKLLSSLT